MPAILLDLTGQRFERWTFLRRVGRRGKNAVWECRCDCGTVRNRRAVDRFISKSCGCYQREDVSRRASLTGPKHWNWKGGTCRHGGGYIFLKARDHPRANRSGYVFEHILVMEKMIGRELLPGETVHHRNGVKSDNAPANLELWDTNHCAGQRHIEKMAFHVQEIVCKASLEEMEIIQSAITTRLALLRKRKPD